MSKYLTEHSRVDCLLVDRRKTRTSMVGCSEVLVVISKT